MRDPWSWAVIAERRHYPPNEMIAEWDGEGKVAMRRAVAHPLGDELDA
jgi:hypothetical protein